MSGRICGLAACLRQERVQSARVIVVHIGENDLYTGSAKTVALDIYSVIAGHLVTFANLRRLLIAELLPFPKDRRHLSAHVNEELKKLVDAGDGRIRMWKHSSVLYSSKAYSADKVHLSCAHSRDYWQSMKDAVVSGLTAE